MHVWKAWNERRGSWGKAGMYEERKWWRAGAEGCDFALDAGQRRLGHGKGVIEDHEGNLQDANGGRKVIAMLSSPQALAKTSGGLMSRTYTRCSWCDRTHSHFADGIQNRSPFLCLMTSMPVITPHLSRGAMPYLCHRQTDTPPEAEISLQTAPKIDHFGASSLHATWSRSWQRPMCQIHEPHASETWPGWWCSGRNTWEGDRRSSESHVSIKC